MFPFLGILLVVCKFNSESSTRNGPFSFKFYIPYYETTQNPVLSYDSQKDIH